MNGAIFDESWDLSSQWNYQLCTYKTNLTNTEKYK